MRKNDLLKFYDSAKQYVLQRNYGDEIEWQNKVDFSRVNATLFFLEYEWVVISSGMKNQVARQIHRRFHDPFPNWDAIGHPHKRKSLQQMWAEFPQHFEEFKSKTTDIEKLDYLQTLPHIGKITKYHLAKNLGLQVAKPDRHLVRVAESFGYGDVQKLCSDISDATGDKIAVVDLIIWRYCNLHPKHSAGIIPLDEVK